MNGTERRQEIIVTLSQSTAPVSGQKLSEALGVSRQVIVRDIALLRAAGHAIASTNRGYVLDGAVQAVRLVKVRHDASRMSKEMNTVVDLGGCLMDVMVNHRIYGFVSAPLDIKNRREVKRFTDQLNEGISEPLSALTAGYHFHHICAESEEILDEIETSLEQEGFIAPLTKFEAETL